MKKRILSLLLVLLMVVSLVPTAALAARGDTDIAYPVTGGNIYFDKSTGTITYCDSSVKEAIIPETIEGVGVSCIGSSAFYKCRRLTSVTIPNSVTSISNWAFDGCTSLMEFVVSESSKSFSAVEGALFNKEKTMLIRYPLGKTNTSYEILNSVTSIGDWAFRDCKNLTSVNIPSSVKGIGHSAFSGCTSLTSIEIPDSVTSIGGRAFSDCTGLTNVTIPNSVATIDHNTFNGCTGLTSVKIPDSVTSIGDSAFQDCKELMGIIIPNSVTSIGIAAFYGCKSLTSIEIPNGVEIIDQRVFQDCTNLTSIEIPNSVTYIGWYAFGYCTNLTKITIPNRVRGIGSNAFECCTSLTSVELSNSVRSISQYAFQGCTALKNLTMPSQLREIGQSAFKDCTGLETLNIPSAETIDASAFSGCTGLTSVSLPKNVKTIGNAAFRYCENIKDVYYSGSETEWNAITIQPYNEPITNAAIHYAGETHTHNYVDGVCTICGAKDPNYVPPHTHDYKAVVTAPTCTEKGYTTYTCSCGYSYKDNWTDALGHSYTNGKCIRCGVKDPSAAAPSFVDVPSTSYCYDAVQWAVANGVTAGTDSTHFSPNAGCTRAQVVTFLWRAAGKPITKTLISFSDVQPGAYYYEAVKWAVANGITAGTDAAHFSPNATCTRGQVVTFLFRAANSPSASTFSSFSDVPATAFYYNAVNWAVANGITSGVGNNRFAPNDTCTRGQVVTFLYRAQ